MKKCVLQSRRRGQTSTAPESLRFPITGTLTIENLSINELRRYENNPRLHPKTQIDKLARAIKEFGFLVPILIDNQSNVLAGHARLEAAGKLALPYVPCIPVI